MPSPVSASPGDPATTGAPPDLELAGVTVTFGGLTALSDVGLALARHTVHGVIGPNGAGKTTFFNVACGFVRPDAGTLRVRGEERALLRPHDLAGLGIARTLQGLGLFDRLTVLDNVVVGADRHARTGFLAALAALPHTSREERELRTRALEALESLGVAGYADRLPPSLPYPVRKRVALARAMVAEPEVLLLDEPASGLSADEIDELAALVRGVTDRMSVMLVEHHMDLVMQVCDEITVLDFGKVIAHGPPDEVRQDPAVLAAYLGEEVATDARRRGAHGRLRRGDGAARRVAERRARPGDRGARGQRRRARPRCCAPSPACTAPAPGGSRSTARTSRRLAAERMPALGMSHVPEGRGVITELTVEENLRLGRPRPRPGAAPPTSTACSTSSRCSPSGAAPPPARCRAASGRCSWSGARSWPSRRCCCSTSRRWAWPRRSSPRSSSCCRASCATTG